MPTSTFTLGDFTITANAGDEFHTLKQEIFTKDNYYFETDNPEPVIIDGGAHVGLATLYFKKLYPNAHIIAIEPHPETARLLQTNIDQNFLSNCTVIQAALSDRSDPFSLYYDETDNEWLSTAGLHNGSWNGTQKSAQLIVPTIQLSTLLNQKIDLLKLDIEGMEQKVLQQAHALLPNIKQMIIEFHPTKQQDVRQLREMLKKRFNLSYWYDGKEIAKPENTKGLFLIEATRK